VLKELVEAAERFRAEGHLLPVAYKPKRPQWVVNLSGGEAYLEGPYKSEDVRAWPAPDRQRSGRPSEGNLKPYLLIDDARHVFGKADPGREDEARLLHRSYLDLLEDAWKSTRVPELAEVLEFLRGPDAASVAEPVGPRDLVAFRVNGSDPGMTPKVQEFWAYYLAKELALETPGQCSTCGRPGEVLRILPREVVILGQKCQLISFNRGAFCSFGKEQNANAPLCFRCASSAVDALDYLTRAERHRRVLVSSAKGSPLKNQLAVFWLKRPVVGCAGDRSYDLEDLLGALLEDSRGQIGPPPELAQLQAMLGVAWTAEDQALNLKDNQFYLAVLSANQGRLVVREWLAVSIGKLRDNLNAFLQATRLVDPTGSECRPQSIPSMVRSLGGEHPNLVRGLLRTALLGFPPPPGLLEAAVARFRVPTVLRDRQLLHTLAAAIKLGLTHRRREARSMEALSPDRKTAAYFCGRLLAVLEEAQQRASGWRLDSTLADRFYGAASTAPAVTLPLLLARAQSSHLPKIRKENRGYVLVQRLLEEILTALGGSGGFPRVLSLPEQAEFALGFYHQRAALRAGRAQGPGEIQN